MEFLSKIVDVFLHLDSHLNQWIGELGIWIYLLLFLVIFCETGLVVTPFLPGDSLLFALGALTVTESAVLKFWPLAALLIVAGILGDAVNYAIGKRVGPRVFASEGSRWLKRSHLERTRAFYERHGGKTIVLARFVPIVRTFAPFVAGIGRMGYRKFAAYNVTGAIAWVMIFLTAGAAFGNVPAVKKNFQLVIFGIIGLSVAPIAWEIWKARRSAEREGAAT